MYIYIYEYSTSSATAITMRYARAIITLKKMSYP